MKRLWLLLVCLVLSSHDNYAWAQSDEDSQATAAPHRLRSLTILSIDGNPDSLSGSGHLVDKETLERTYHRDVSRTLLQNVPGVHVREEDGYGLFPNISLRGVDAGRSSKVTLMEDGLLAAPAPYSAPAAYYSPNVGRMESLEILKGSSQVKFGPHTTGGAINFLSTSIPEMRGGQATLMWGSDDELRAHLSQGGTLATSAGRFGYLVEIYSQETNGFKNLDHANSLDGKTSTGFKMVEPMVKLSWEPNSARFQRWELKYGRTDLDANESYLGLSLDDFEATPYRRYAASQLDEMMLESDRGYLRYTAELSDSVQSATSVYAQRTHRNWYKLDRVGLTAGTMNSLSAALSDAALLDVLRGEQSGFLNLKANNRIYESYGVQEVISTQFATGSLNHDLELGVRYHQDSERRAHKIDTFEMDSGGQISSATSIGAYASDDHRLAEAKAVSAYVQNSVTAGALTLTPGVRMEWVEYSNENFLSGTEGDASMDAWAAGLGMSYSLTENSALFGGLFRGISLPGPGGAINDGVKEEQATSLELGYRTNSSRWALESAAFFTDFRDLIVTDNVGGGVATGVTENVGRAQVLGVELTSTYDWALGRGFSQPWYLTATYNHARLKGDASTNSTDGPFSGARDGSRMPYIPDWQATLGAALTYGNWNADLTYTWVGDMYSTAANVAGNPADVREGKIKAHSWADLSAHYQLTEGTRLVGQIYNLFAQEYLVSLHPYGPRPGRAQSFLVGVNASL